MKQLVRQNLFAIVVNVAGNVVLMPKYGAYAAAWMTTVTEVGVCGAAILSLRRDLDFRTMARASRRPLLVTALATVVAVPLLGSQYLALLCAAVTFLGGATIARAWPPELTSAVRRRVDASRGAV